MAIFNSYVSLPEGNHLKAPGIVQNQPNVDLFIEKMMADVDILLEMMVNVRLVTYSNPTRLTWHNVAIQKAIVLPNFR